MTHFKCKLWKITIHEDAGFALNLKKVIIDNQSQCKKLGIFLFSFFSDQPTLQILKKVCAPGN